MNFSNDRRKVKQIPEYDQDGRISHYIIPNYTLREEFLTSSERDFFRILIKVVANLNLEYQNNNISKHIGISTQVAINRIIDINNERNRALYNEIKDKSIDYVLFDLNSGNIECCIELNGPEHEEDEERIKRDNLLRKIFEETNMKFIEVRKELNIEQYDTGKILKKLKE